MYQSFIEQNPLQFYSEDICPTYYLRFSFENYVPSKVLKGVSVENIETPTITYPLKFLTETYFSQVSNCVFFYTLYS